MVPVCLTPFLTEFGEYDWRYKLNTMQDNPIAYVIVDTSVNAIAYAYALWQPSDMNVLQFTQERNISQKPQQEQSLE